MCPADKISMERASRGAFFRKLKRESLVIVRDTTDQFYMTIDPLLNFEFGKDLEDKTGEKLYKNTRGVLVRGDIGENFSFESSFYENQATFAKYIDDHIASTDTAFRNQVYYPYHVIPGQGRSKPFKLNGYDFAYVSGYISYSPNSHFNLQAGHGKHFVGDGYRSLLLSDNAFNYPYIRITSTFGKFQYTNLYTSFMNLTDGGVATPPNTERLFQKKAGSFQYLSWNVHRRVQLGLFQGMIWERADNMNRQHVDASFFNPIIFANAMEYGLDGTNNILIGSTLRLKITNSISLYGQYMVDDDGSKGTVNNKNGWQAGLKYFDLFTVKNLHLQVEMNRVSPYSYSSKVPEQNYSHYNQPLAHPLGANFSETVVLLDYRTGDFFTEVKLNMAQIGKDSTGRNFGSCIFNPDANSYSYSNVSFLQGVKTSLSYKDFKIGYLINPGTNLNIVLGISLREEKNALIDNKTTFVYFGIRTSLTNVYYDF